MGSDKIDLGMVRRRMDTLRVYVDRLDGMQFPTEGDSTVRDRNRAQATLAKELLFMNQLCRSLSSSTMRSRSASLVGCFIGPLMNNLISVHTLWTRSSCQPPSPGGHRRPVLAERSSWECQGMTAPLGSIRFRFFLDGQLVRQETAEVASGQHLADLGATHSMWMAQQAEATKSKWLVEAEVLNDPTDPERFLRFGTDEGGMRDPHPLLG